MANTFMKLMIDDSVWGFEEIFSDFGEIVTLPGRQIDRQSLLDCDILIIRSRTRLTKSYSKELRFNLLVQPLLDLTILMKPICMKTT